MSSVSDSACGDISWKIIWESKQGGVGWGLVIIVGLRVTFLH